MSVVPMFGAVSRAAVSARHLHWSVAVRISRSTEERMRRSDVTGFVGPVGVGSAYGSWVENVIESENLSELILASAYLTTAGAEQLLAALLGRNGLPETNITVLVGTKDRFTQRKAIELLLSARRNGLQSPV